MLNELLKAKPCPFCGEKSITIREGSTFRWMLAECNGCGATCGEVRVQTIGPGLLHNGKPMPSRTLSKSGTSGLNAEFETKRMKYDATFI